MKRLLGFLLTVSLLLGTCSFVVTAESEEINEYQWWLISHDKTEEEEVQLLKEDWVQQRLKPEEKIYIESKPEYTNDDYYIVTVKQNYNRVPITTESFGIPDVEKVIPLYAPYNTDRLYNYINAEDFHATYLVKLDNVSFGRKKLSAVDFVLSVDLSYATTEPAVVRPDLDGDFKTTANDALWLLQYLVEKRLVTWQQLRYADRNGDGVYDASDALGILKMSVQNGAVQ